MEGVAAYGLDLIAMSIFKPIESYRRRQGYQLVAGLDEVGRGAWAGPLVAAALILKPYVKLPDLRDSKQVTPLARARWAKRIISRAISFSYGLVSEKEIDKVGISEANNLAFRRAVSGLKPQPDYVLADYFSVENCFCPIEGVRDGDKCVRVIAAASIIAKVYRDAILIKADRRFPGYSFAEHKGYGTAAHRRVIKKLGLSPYHRKSFHCL
ncbi:MAG: Ribonuclease HII [Parcubacteria group bacterium GW2011_GWA2_46_9]|nr:MAG: Ribonuclease HII [Parcubacteria group bacterium GW2011_GWA2_46_9]